MLFAVALVLIAKWRQPANWSKLARAGVLLGLGLLIPLTPWAARNWRTLHEVRFLAPRYAELPGEFTPQGFVSWTNTWLWKYGDVYLTLWKLDSEEIHAEDIPASAFDSPEQQEHVAELLEQYSEITTMDPVLDAEFARIARERRTEHPFRTYLNIPLLRSLALWFTPRVELLPLSGHMWPLSEKWHDDTADFVTTLGLFIINCVYVALAIAGAWMARKRPGVALLIAFILISYRLFCEICGNAGAALRAGVLSRDNCTRFAGFPWTRSVFSDRLRVNCQPQDLRKMFLHTAFERRGYIVNLGDRQIAVHGAVAGHHHFVFHAAHVHVVAIDHFRIIATQGNYIALNRKRVEALAILQRQVRACRAARCDMLMSVPGSVVAEMPVSSSAARWCASRRLHVSFTSRCKSTKRCPSRWCADNSWIARPRRCAIARIVSNKVSFEGARGST